MSKLKMTGFGRFVIFLLILGPIAYFGAKYLRESGIWDNVTEKVEKSREDNEQAETQIENEEDILRDIRRNSEKKSQSEQEALIAEQERKIQELERQNEALRNSKSDNSPNVPTPPITTERASPTQSSGDSDFDDLLKEADDFIRGKGGNPEDTQASGSSDDIIRFTFSFSQVSGELQLYEEKGRVMCRTVYNGTNRIDINELVAQGDKLMVRNSPTGEYYILRNDGDLDAFDQNGFQTTCKRQ